jgi:MoaA/NifB/PqqE/SkfB family radical SAM enzyme
MGNEVSDVQKSQRCSSRCSIELTERCNFGCIHCYLGEQAPLRRKRESELDTTEWRGILDQIAALGCLRLLITGGEPLLRPDFEEVFRHAKRLGMIITVFTNGSLVDDAIIELFRDLPPASVEITLYGATAEVFEGITRVPGSFRRCMEAIERIRSLAGVELGVKAVMMRQNQHEFKRIAAMARALGTRKFRFDVDVQCGYDGDHGPLQARLSVQDAVHLELSDPETLTAWQERFHTLAGVRRPNTAQLYGCGAGRNGLHVNPYGQLQPCLEIRHLRYNLRQGTAVDGLAQLRKALAERLAPMSYACRDCAESAVCTACPAVAMLETGSEAQPSAFTCELVKARHALAAGHAELGGYRHGT